MLHFLKFLNFLVLIWFAGKCNPAIFLVLLSQGVLTKNTKMENAAAKNHFHNKCILEGTGISMEHFVLIWEEQNIYHDYM